jgi:DNA-binding IclR family transcriptional regulator
MSSENAAADTDVGGPRSLTRLLGLFDALARKPDGLSLAQLNTILESPKSSLLNLLRPLVAAEYLSHDEGRYRLGAAMFRLSANVLSGWNFSKMIHPFMEELAKRSNESAFLGVLDRGLQVVTYVDVIDSTLSVRYAIPVGGSRPLYCTASGRALLAFEDPEWIERYIRTTKLEPKTPKWSMSRKALRAELQKIRETGISISIGELFPDSAGIAAPVFGANGKAVAAIAVGAPSERLRANLPALRELVADVAARASLGVSGRRGVAAIEVP